MAAKTFFDTNVLIYAVDSAFPEKQKIALELIAEHARNRTGVISTQVLQEFYVNVRRKTLRPISASEASQVLRDYIAWEVVVNDGAAICVYQ